MSDFSSHKRAWREIRSGQSWGVAWGGGTIFCVAAFLLMAALGPVYLSAHEGSPASQSVTVDHWLIWIPIWSYLLLAFGSILAAAGICLAVTGFLAPGPELIPGNHRRNTLNAVYAGAGMWLYGYAVFGFIDIFPDTFLRYFGWLP